jgi:hypothetical protein
MLGKLHDSEHAHSSESKHLVNVVFAEPYQVRDRGGDLSHGWEDNEREVEAVASVQKVVSMRVCALYM